MEADTYLANLWFVIFLATCGQGPQKLEVALFEKGVVSCQKRWALVRLHTRVEEPLWVSEMVMVVQEVPLYS